MATTTIAGIAGELLIATPEYSGLVPCQFKNALDWASRSHRGSVLQGRPP
jgi:NAD(P)H-dependent FMN reductase